MTRYISNEKLKQILVNHKMWLNDEGGKRADLSGANLCRADLSNADLREADLSNADLSGANLRGADISGANLRGADFSDTDLKDTDFDFSCIPLWCSSLTANFDDKQLREIAYHLVRAGLQSKNASEKTKQKLSKLIDFANEFHRAGTKGYEFIEKPCGENDNDKSGMA